MKCFVMSYLDVQQIINCEVVLRLSNVIIGLDHVIQCYVTSQYGHIMWHSHLFHGNYCSDYFLPFFYVIKDNN